MMTGRFISHVRIIAAAVGVAIAGCALQCCGPSHAERQLEQIDRLCELYPDSALRLLEAIETDSLSDSERSLHSLLTVKSLDKAYVKPASDSLISSAIAYYSRHQSSPWYAEALYYGGRVASELGDYPSAIRYFQDALNLLPDDTSDRRLRGNVLSQTGRLLNKMRLFDEAENYLKISVGEAKQDKDSIALLMDSYLLAQVFIQDEKYAAADSLLNECVELAERVKPDYRDRILMNKAAIKYYQGDYATARNMILDLPERIDLSRKIADSYAYRIYRKIGVMDTSFIYAQRLKDSKNDFDRKVGYEAMLSEDFKAFVPTDSLYSYISRYIELSEDYIDRNADEMALIQNSMYNYRNHERERLKAERRKRKLAVWLYITGAILLLGIVWVLFYRLRQKNKQLRLQVEINKHQKTISDLELKLQKAKEDRLASEINKRSIEILDAHDLEILRQSLREVLCARVEANLKRPPLSKIISGSNAYKELLSVIRDKRHLPYDSPLWDELRKVINKASPTFERDVELLLGDSLSDEAFHTILLIKCGATASQMAHVLAKEKGTLSNRRRILCKEMMKKDLGAIAFDTIIYSL